MRSFCVFMNKLLATLFVVFLSVNSWAQKGQFETVENYSARFFAADAAWQTLWVKKDMRTDIEKILGHRFSGLRIRYWGEVNRTGWVFEEIGKEMPITVAVVVEEGEVIDVTILEYRESRGGEVRYPFFTQQFKRVGLEKGTDYRLNKHIDGITGATLSVRALKKIVTLALFCHQQTSFATSK